MAETRNLYYNIRMKNNVFMLILFAYVCVTQRKGLAGQLFDSGKAPTIPCMIFKREVTIFY